MNAVIAKSFNLPLFTAKPSGGENDWWYVENSSGFNVLTFQEKPGAKFTDESNAKAIANEWNTNGKKDFQ